MDQTCKMNKPTDKYDTISTNILAGFYDIADYFWKSPRLLEHETKLESQKTKDYFLHDARRGNLRWQIEYERIKSVFPYLISLGNMFSVMSVFESYLLVVSSNLEMDTGEKMESISGIGIRRLLGYLRVIGIDVETIDLFHQVDASIRIRIYILHASGILAWSKEEKEVRRIQISGTYLSREHRRRRR